LWGFFEEMALVKLIYMKKHMEKHQVLYYEFQGENLRHFMKSIVVTSQGQALQASIYVF